VIVRNGGEPFSITGVRIEDLWDVGGAVSVRIYRKGVANPDIQRVTIPVAGGVNKTFTGMDNVIKVEFINTAGANHNFCLDEVGLKT
jgi:hypothetical protein